VTDPKYMRPGYDFAIGKLVEEAGELQEALGRLQAALGKTLRFGPESVNPEKPHDEQESNAAWVEREIIDVLGAAQNYLRADGFRRVASAVPFHADYCHVKRGSRYRIIGNAVLQDASSRGVEEGAILVIYQGENGSLWARADGEFLDGRFVPAAAIT